VALVILSFATRAQSRTMTFATVDNVDTVAFDPHEISEQQLRQLILLSPFIVSYFNDLPHRDFLAAGSSEGELVHKVFLALPLELCVATDPAYSHCENNQMDGPNFLRNAKVNVQKSRRGLEWLQHLQYPEQLRPVAKFLLDGLAFSLRIEEKRLDYYSTWDENRLRESSGDIHPGQLCPETCKNLERAKSESAQSKGAQCKEERYRIVRFEWANCRLKAMDKKLGYYPISSWNAFLSTHRIAEHYQEKGPD
jgi:hypothetical protein